MISSIDPHCHNITNISLVYQLTTSQNVTTVYLLPDVNMFVIDPEEEGRYDIKLVIENNEGYRSYNMIHGVNVNGKY